MNEVEGLKKETAGELTQETPKAPETPKESKIQKFYKVCGLIQNILLGMATAIPKSFSVFFLIIIKASF